MFLIQNHDIKWSSDASYAQAHMQLWNTGMEYSGYWDQSDFRILHKCTHILHTYILM